MDERKHVCPACNVIFDAPPLDGPTVCPLCGSPLPDTPAPEPPPEPEPGPAPEPVLLAAPASQTQNLRWIVAAAVVAFVGGTLVLAMPQWTDPTRAPEASVSAPALPEPVELIPEKDALPSDISWDHALPTQLLIQPPKRPGAPAPAHPAARSGPSPAQVDRAIERGVAYLKQHIQETRLPLRYEGLVGLALLECGVPYDDPVVQRIGASLRGQMAQLTGTYEMSLTVLFFDRFDTASSSARIRTLGEAIAAGQVENGAWGYQCRRVTVNNQPPWKPNGLPVLRPAVPPRNLGRPAFHPWSDHSNTQFAVLALWIAGRHGRNTRLPLDRADRHYRDDQHKDGGWGYRPGDGPSTLANTCSGLLALAAGHGINAQAGREARPLAGPQGGKDPAVAAALDRVADFLVPAWARDGARANGPVMGSNCDLYTLWSVERVATLYDLARIGGREWYPDFARHLVDVQEEDGSWRRSLPAPIDTCFALLVLRRSNLVPDLTAVIQGKPAPVRQPGLGWTAADPSGKPLSPGGPARTPAAPKSPPTLAPTGPVSTKPPALSGDVQRVGPVPAKPADDPPVDKDP